MKTLKGLVYIAVVWASIIGLALIGRASDDFHGEWSVLVTNETATLGMTNLWANDKKISSVWFHHSAASTCTVTVDVVKGTVTNRVASTTLTAAQDAQWGPAKKEWLRAKNSIIVGSNSTNPCTIKVQFDK
jgi:hypothetical protein